MQPVILRPSRGAIVIAAVVAAVLLPAYVSNVATAYQPDFNAFRCAGSAVLHGQNPYLDASLHDCEVAHGLEAVATIPVPYPPYVLWLFVVEALLPASLSYAVWCIVSIVFTVLAAVALKRLTDLSWSVVISATAVSLFIPNFFNTQPVTIAVCGLAWSLVLLEERRDSAAIGLAALAVFPNFALGAWAAALACVKRLWLPLAGCIALFAAASIAAVGIVGIGPYVRELQAHGASEATLYFQLGSEAILYGLGVRPPYTAVVSVAAYFALVGIGIAVGMRLKQRFGNVSWPVASACAFETLGSPYMHGWDAAFALPFALMLLATARTRRSAVLAIAFVVPWEHLAEHGGIQGAITIPPLLVLFDAVAGGSTLVAAGAVTGVLLVTLFIANTSNSATEQRAAFERLPHPTPARDAVSDVRWTEYAHARTATVEDWLRKIPYYAALVLFLSSAFRRAYAAEPGLQSPLGTPPQARQQPQRSRTRETESR
jgi:hypothetical protein